MDIKNDAPTIRQ